MSLFDESDKGLNKNDNKKELSREDTLNEIYKDMYGDSYRRVTANDKIPAKEIKDADAPSERNDDSQVLKEIYQDMYGDSYRKTGEK